MAIYTTEVEGVLFHPLLTSTEHTRGFLSGNGFDGRWVTLNPATFSSPEFLLGNLMFQEGCKPGEVTCLGIPQALYEKLFCKAKWVNW